MRTAASSTARPDTSAPPARGAASGACSVRCSRERSGTTGRRSDRRSPARRRPRAAARARASLRRSGTVSPVAKAVADTADGQDVLGRPRLGLELLAQVPDVDVDRAGIAVVRALPERLEQHAPAEDPPRL